MKEYKYKKTKKLIKQLKPFLKKFQIIEDRYYKEIYALEKEIERVTGIPEPEFFYCDNEVVGLGNTNRDMELIHRQDLEE